MIDPVKKQEDKIRYDYLKKELTFEDFRKQRKKQKQNLIIFALVLFFFIYVSFCLAFLYSLSSESKTLWKETTFELGEEVCENIGEGFVNLRVGELPDGTKRVQLTCSDTIKLFYLKD